MNDKPHLPEQMHSIGARAGGGWMLVAMATDVPGAWLLSHHQGWPLVLRVAIVVLPLVATLLYVRAAARWIRGMDELHRRITQASVLFATIAYLFLNTAWPLLDRAGVFDALFEVTHLHLERMPFTNCTFALGMTFVLWGIGYAHIFNRRYR